jgi:hypothetical protein
MRGVVPLVIKEADNGNCYSEPERQIGVDMNLHGLAQL